ncbi:MAG: hypothetical protein ACXW1S_03110, partial [Acidimicrobiia bacterium]
TLFIREDEVDQAWRVVQPLIEAFRAGTVPLHRYPAGTWGPVEAEMLFTEPDDHWREPERSEAVGHDREGREQVSDRGGAAKRPGEP